MSQLTLGESFSIGDKRTVEVTYFIAKEEVAFTKYPAILTLEEMLPESMLPVPIETT